MRGRHFRAVCLLLFRFDEGSMPFIKSSLHLLADLLSISMRGAIGVHLLFKKQLLYQFCASGVCPIVDTGAWPRGCRGCKEGSW
jgi:hypothetical protein